MKIMNFLHIIFVSTAVIAMQHIIIAGQMSAEPVGSIEAIINDTLRQELEKATIETANIESKATEAIANARKLFNDGLLTPVEAAQAIGEQNYIILDAKERLAALVNKDVAAVKDAEAGYASRLMGYGRAFGEKVSAPFRAGYGYTKEEKDIARSVIAQLEEFKRIANNPDLEEDLDNAILKQQIITGDVMSDEKKLKLLLGAIGVAATVAGIAYLGSTPGEDSAKSENLQPIQQPISPVKSAPALKPQPKPLVQPTQPEPTLTGPQPTEQQTQQPASTPTPPTEPIVQPIQPIPTLEPQPIPTPISPIEPTSLTEPQPTSTEPIPLTEPTPPTEPIAPIEPIVPIEPIAPIEPTTSTEPQPEVSEPSVLRKAWSWLTTPSEEQKALNESFKSKEARKEYEEKLFATKGYYSMYEDAYRAEHNGQPSWEGEWKNESIVQQKLEQPIEQSALQPALPLESKPEQPITVTPELQLEQKNAPITADKGLTFFERYLPAGFHDRQFGTSPEKRKEIDRIIAEEQQQYQEDVRKRAEEYNQKLAAEKQNFETEKQRRKEAAEAYRQNDSRGLYPEKERDYFDRHDRYFWDDSRDRSKD